MYVCNDTVVLVFITWQMEGGYVLLYNSGYDYVIAV